MSVRWHRVLVVSTVHAILSPSFCRHMERNPRWDDPLMLSMDDQRTDGRTHQMEEPTKEGRTLGGKMGPRISFFHFTTCILPLINEIGFLAPSLGPLKKGNCLSTWETAWRGAACLEPSPIMEHGTLPTVASLSFVSYSLRLVIPCSPSFDLPLYLSLSHTHES